MKEQIRVNNRYLILQFMTVEETIARESKKVFETKKIDFKPLDFVFAISPEKIN